MTVIINYLTTAGKKYEEANGARLDLTFEYKSEEAQIADMTWVVNGDNLTATSEIVGPSVDIIKEKIARIDWEIAYTDGKVEINGQKNLEYVDDDESITLALEGLDKDGNKTEEADKIVKYVIKATFKPTKIAAVSHTATVKFINNAPDEGLNNDVLYETSFTIMIDQQDSKLFKFERAESYFSNDNATAYGKAEDGEISYDLYTLYKNTTALANGKQYITFTEERPSKVENNQEKYAPAWLDKVDEPTANSVIAVETFGNWGGAYDSRYITASYAPFGNPLLNAIKDRFNLTVKSEIFEGIFEYIGEEGTKDKPFEVDGGHSQDLLAENFKKEDAYGKEYLFDDSRIKSVTLKLANQNAKDYLKLSTTDFISAEEGIVVISKKDSATPIVNPPVCEINVEITDEWGKTTIETIFVKVIK